MSDNNTKDLVNKALEDFNRLPESTINPLMIGLGLVGVAITVFNPGTLVYLAMAFGASAGIAYAASKNLSTATITPIPTWMTTTLAVVAALVYSVAGMPGLMLTAGASGGWYLNSYFGHRFQQWKTDFQNFLTKFKNNPVRQSINLTFNGLKFLGDILTPVENIAPAPAQQAEQVEHNQPVALNIPAIVQTAIAAIPTQVIFSSNPIPNPHPTGNPILNPNNNPNLNTGLITLTPKPETAVIRFMGNPILTTPKKEIQIDFKKGYGLTGLLKIFWHSLNPMNDFVDINKDKDNNKDKKDNINVQAKPILAIADNTPLEPTPVVFRRVPLSRVTPPVVVAENNQAQPPLAANIIQSPASTASEAASLKFVQPDAKPATKPAPVVNAQPKIAILPTIVEAAAEINSISVLNSSPVLISEPARHLHPALLFPLVASNVKANAKPTISTPVILSEPVVNLTPVSQSAEVVPVVVAENNQTQRLTANNAKSLLVSSASESASLELVQPAAKPAAKPKPLAKPATKPSAKPAAKPKAATKVSPKVNAQPKITILPTIAEAEINSVSVLNSSPVLISEPVSHLHPALLFPLVTSKVKATPTLSTPVIMPEPVVKTIPTPEVNLVEAGMPLENAVPKTNAIRRNPDPVLFYQLPRGMRFFENMINETVFSDYRRRI